MTDVPPTPSFSPAGVSRASPARASRTRRVAVVAASVTLVLATATAVTLLRPPASASPTTVAAPINTVPVTTGDMVSVVNAKATLHLAHEAELLAALAGVLTALPPTGTVITPGGTLYRIDDRPVILLRGSHPAWRTFELGMSAGEDVRQLEQNLAAFGVFSGDIDTTFTNATATAISLWQKSLGVERTGRLDRTAIMFSDHDLRAASSSTVALGAIVAPGTLLYRVSATDRIIDLDLRLADQQLAVPGVEVTIVLPDSRTTTGSVNFVGEPVEREKSSEPQESTGAPAAFVVPVTVALADQAAVADFSRASVTVQFSSPLANDVLTVPVEALVATGASSFAVETPGERSGDPIRTLPVNVGAVTSGSAQISGDGVHEGLAVVVPAP